jgi:DNA primase
MSALEEIKKANPIIDVAQELGLDVPASGLIKCFSPENHSSGDQHPSLRFDRQRNRYRCWSCGQIDGDVIDLVRQLRPCGFREAVEYLADRAKLSPPESNRKAAHVHCDKVADARTKFVILARDHLLRTEHVYFLSRGISPRVIRAASLGYIDCFSAFVGKVEAKYGKSAVKKAGLHSFYVYGKHDIPFVTIPYIVDTDRGRKCACLKARAASPVASPKYVATNGEVPFLFNHQRLADVEKIFITEGEIDCLTLASHGYPAVGVPGAKTFKSDWAPLFTGKDVYIVFDADTPGKRGTQDIAMKLKGHARQVRRVPLPRGTDVNDFFHGKAHHG